MYRALARDASRASARATALPLAEGRLPFYNSAEVIAQTPKRDMYRTARFFAAAARAASSSLQSQVGVASPDGRDQVTVELREGRPRYSLSRGQAIRIRRAQ